MTVRMNWDQIGPAADGPFFSDEDELAAPAIRGDRLFLGAARYHSQHTDGSVTGGSYLQSFTVAGGSITVTDFDYFEDLARAAVVNDFGLAVVGVSRTTADVDAIGVTGAGFARANTGNKKAWGFYGHGDRHEVGAGDATGIEVNSAQIPEPSPGNAGVTDFFMKGRTPYKGITSGEVVVARFAAGSDAAKYGRSYAVDAIINLQNNGAAAWTGINVPFDAIMREGVADDKSSPGNTGYARVFSTAHDQGWSMYSRDAISVTAGSFVTGKQYIISFVGTTDFTLIGADENTIGEPFIATGPGTGTGIAALAGSQGEVVRMYSTVDSPDIRWAMVFSDLSWALNDRVSPDGAQFQVGYLADAAAHIFVQPAILGGSPRVEARGTNLNIPLTLAPKGTGWLAFGAMTNCPEYADDAAALAGGMAVGGIYRTGSVLKVRAA